MTLKEQILLLLEHNRDRSLSGQELAQTLGVTRGGIWKAIHALQDEGYAIEAVSNRGYRLLKSPDALSVSYLEDALQKEGILLPVILKKETGSTNNDLKQLVNEGETKDLVLLADHQTAGRGRRGRSFYSPAGTGLYLSFLLHPHVNAALGSMLTTLAAVAASKAIEETCKKDALIKWVNDVYVPNENTLKKVCGILTECSVSMEDQTLDYVIVGIGFNVYEPDGGFPADIEQKAGSILGNVPKEENHRNRLAASFIHHFMEYYKSFPQISFHEEYKKRCFVLGKEILLLPTGCEDLPSATKDPKFPSVKALDLDESFGLIVEYPDGHRETLTSGEFSIRF